jgi:predicted dehydrogenase
MEIAVAAARAGKHVIVEKPIEVSLERADAVIEACRKGGVKLACIFPARLKPGAEKLKKAVTEGRLGRLTLCDVQVKWHRSQEYYDAGGWRGTWEWDGGGALMNQGIHHVDLLQYIAGPVRSVFAQCATLAHTMETEDTVAASLSFESGALGVIEATTGAWPGLAGRLEISGDRGTVTLEDVAVVRWDLADATEAEKTGVLAERGPEGSGRADPMGIAHHGHLLQIRDLVLAVQEDRTPRIDGYEGRKAVEIVRAVYHSARTGRPVDLPFDE